MVVTSEMRDDVRTTVERVSGELVRLGFRPESVTEAEVKSGRNLNYIVRDEEQGDLFVKILDGEADRTRRVQALVTFAQQVQPRLSRNWSPGLITVDPDAGVLVYEAIVDATAASTLVTRGELTTDVASAIGAVLGELHTFQDTCGIAAAASTESVLLNLEALPVGLYARCSGAQLEAWGVLQHDRQLRAAVRNLLLATECTRPIHGDFRLDQVLVNDDEVVLTDFEEFCLGDPARDVGAFAGELLHRLLFDITADGFDDVSPGEATHEEILKRSSSALQSLRPLVASFMSGYSASSTSPVDVARMVRFAGWHLLDRTFAAATTSARLSALGRAAAGIGRTALLGGERFSATLGLGGNRA